MTLKKFSVSPATSQTQPLKVGCVPQRNLIDKHFQQFLPINQVSSNYREKETEELSQSENNSSLTGKFSHLYQGKDVMTNLIFHLFSKNWMYFAERKTLSSLQSILIWTVFSY